MLRTTYLLSFFLVTLALNALAQQPRPAPAAYHLVGKCHDYGTAQGLTASIYALVDGQRKKIGEGAEAGQAGEPLGTFDVLLPATATHVLLEMPGYHTVKISVHFTPGIPDGARFAFYNLAAMTPLNTPLTSVPSTLVDFLSLCFVESDSTTRATWLDLKSARSSQRYSVSELSPGETIHFPLLPGHYTASLSTAGGRITSAEQFQVSTGVTFKAIRIGKKQTPAAYHVMGYCHDYGNKLRLKASIYALINGQRQKLGECSDFGKFDEKSGIFNVMLPVTASHLIMEAPGYRPVTVPVHFAPNIPADARFDVGDWSAMTSLDSLPKPAGHNGSIAIAFSVVDRFDADFTMNYLANPNWRFSLPLFDKRPTRSLTPLGDFAPGVYTLNLATRDGRFISSDTLTLKEGLTFAGVRIVRPREKAIATERTQPAGSRVPLADTLLSVASSAAGNIPTPVVTAPSTATLYFDQSSPDLRTPTRHSLDSLAPILTAQPHLLATITGYTDNVGRRTLNLTLSEYRARAVATYLTRRGVPAEQLVVRWKGPDTTLSAESSETSKTRSRRVIIQVAPR